MHGATVRNKRKSQKVL